MRKLTHKQFIQRLNDKHDTKYTALEKYCNSRVKILIQCNDCNYKWKTSKILKNGCPECGKKKARETKKWNVNQSDFLEKIPKLLRDKIEILDNYTHQHGKIKVRCKVCSREWVSKPYYLYRGQGCEKCGRRRKGEKSRKTTQCFKDEILKVHGDAIELLSEYKTGDNKIKTKCLQCGFIWNPVARNLLRRGCPQCRSSKGEKKIERILKSNGIKYKSQYSFNDLVSPNGGRLRFDFGVLNNDVLLYLIEYDGQQHFHSIEYMGGKEKFEIRKRNDSLKNHYCTKNDIKLLRIPYTEYSNINKDMICPI